MKIVAYYALHYGREWLNWSLKSIREYVDDIVILYSPTPSHGTRISITCPETREQLRAIAEPYQAHWYEAPHGFPYEGAHRDYAVDLCKIAHGADIILPLDHDEIWDPEHLQRVLKYVEETPYKDYRISMQHFWRSVDWVCRDPLMPVRAIKPNGAGENYVPHMGYMHHFGYAQSPRIVEYKWRIHGHIQELRPGWFENVFMQWRPAQANVHPTNDDFWTAAPFGKSELKSLIGDHPYYDWSYIDNALLDQLALVGTERVLPQPDLRFGG